MDTFKLTIICALVILDSFSFAQYEQPSASEYENSRGGEQNYREDKKKPPAPVAILKQINRHNEDGSYTYGFEGADGSFKIETKSATGDVRGKYGFVDDSGKVRVVEYGANQHGFQPAGEGITVAPPTLVDETTNNIQQGPDAEQDLRYNYNNQPAPQAAPPQSQLLKSPVFRPAAGNSAYRQPEYSPQLAQRQSEYAQQLAAQRQSQLSQQFDYEQRPPASQVNNQGPVQFNPAPGELSGAAAARAPATRATPPGPGILDQLARDYALPQNAAPPLHDISFGYY